MIRSRTPTGYLLINHQDHARLAGAFATLWGNERFAAPEPRTAVLAAVARHDDGWVGRDASPVLTPAGEPSAFTRELVGTYAAFEEVGFEDYLRVRGEATEAVARDEPYAAILVSMHTVNLLTEQMDVTTLTEQTRPLHTRFVAHQRARQAHLCADLRGDPAWEPHLQPPALGRAFRFLQACDNLSLLACARFDRPARLRHEHPDRTGTEHAITVTPEGEDTYRLDPSPLPPGPHRLSLPYRHVRGHHFVSDADLAARFHATPVETLTVTLL